jgi:hypothetical protein
MLRLINVPECALFNPHHYYPSLLYFFLLLLVLRFCHSLGLLIWRVKGELCEISNIGSHRYLILPTMFNTFPYNHFSISPAILTSHFLGKFPSLITLISICCTRRLRPATALLSKPLLTKLWRKLQGSRLRSSEYPPLPPPPTLQFRVAGRSGPKCHI